MTIGINPEAVRRLHTGPRLDPSQAEDPLDLGEAKPAPPIEPPATSAALCRVISVRGRKHAELLADPSFVYVGRKCAGWAYSKWSNPYKVHRLGQSYTNDLIMPTAASAVLRFERDLRQRIRVAPAYYDLTELQGKTLGCWCGDWAPGRPEILCHAVALAKLANALEVHP